MDGTMGPTPQGSDNVRLQDDNDGEDEQEERLKSQSAPLAAHAEDSLEADDCHAALTEAPLDITATMNRVRNPKAGANVLFSGTTRDNFEGKAVATLCYSAYRPRALKSMIDIATTVKAKYNLLSVAVIHRLGPVPIGEDSILIAVSAPHRKAAWQAGEDCLEQVKARVEIWKREDFVAVGGGEGGEEGEKVWRDNKATDKRTAERAKEENERRKRPKTLEESDSNRD